MSEPTTKTQFTPGPWMAIEIDPNDPTWGAFEVVGKDGKYVATMVLGKANAYLIAASPDLYAACDLALDALIDLDNGPLRQRARMALRDALAKVTALKE